METELDVDETDLGDDETDLSDDKMLANMGVHPRHKRSIKCWWRCTKCSFCCKAIGGSPCDQHRAAVCKCPNLCGTCNGVLPWNV
jgi:hypothetical protein